MDYPRMKKDKVFPHAPYDMYSHYQPIFGYFIDDDEKSDSFGQVLFGQIGEKNLQAEVDSYKDECDMTLIKEQLLRSAQSSDWDAYYIDDEEVDESADVKTQASATAPEHSDEITSESGIIDIEDKNEA